MSNYKHRYTIIIVLFLSILTMPTQAYQTTPTRYWLVNGQSNAVSPVLPQDSNGANENQRDYIRTFRDGNWFVADGDTRNGESFVGRWPLVLARIVSDKHPGEIVIINHGEGSKEISYFLPGNPHYISVKQRTDDAGITELIDTIFWYQGESDVISGTSAADYKSRFDHLYTSWQRDYPAVQTVYIIQIASGCGSNSAVEIQQAQAEIVSYYDNVKLVITEGVPKYDVCHYTYQGYFTIAEYVFSEMNKETSLFFPYISNYQLGKGE